MSLKIQSQLFNHPAIFKIAGIIFINAIQFLKCQANLQGDINSAIQHIQAADFTFDTGAVVFWIESPQITQCRVMIARTPAVGLNSAFEMLEQQWQVVKNTFNKAKRKLPNGFSFLPVP